MLGFKEPHSQKETAFFQIYQKSIFRGTSDPCFPAAEPPVNKVSAILKFSILLYFILAIEISPPTQPISYLFRAARTLHLKDNYSFSICHHTFMYINLVLNSKG